MSKICYLFVFKIIVLFCFLFPLFLFSFPCVFELFVCLFRPLTKSILQLMN